MKKILLSLVAVFATFGLTGCKEDVNLDLESISKELDALTTGVFDMQAINVEGLGAFDEMSYIYDYDFDKYFDVSSEYVLQYSVQYNEDTKELLAVFQPTDGDSDLLKEEMDEFIEELDNVLFSEHEGHLIYISSSNNQLVLERVKNSEALVFNNLIEVSKFSEDENVLTMSTVLGLEEGQVSEFLMKTPMMMTSSATYIIVKPADGQEDVVSTKLEEYVTNLENQWSTYLPDQYELVKNRKVEKIGEYFVYIISDNNDLVFDAIKN